MFCVFELLLVLVLFTEMCLWQVSQSWLFIVEISHLGNVWREVFNVQGFQFDYL